MPSNGPDLGHVTTSVQSRPGDGPAVWKLSFDAADSDGYVSRVVVERGDGAREVIEFPLSECVDPGTYWPRSDRRVPAEHRFATEERAQHSVTVTRTSVGCDGRDPQTLGGWPYARTSQQW